MEVRVLSIRQPFADWIIHGTPEGRKFVENRTWTTAYRGRLYIHASRWEAGYGDIKAAEATPTTYRTGAIIGYVELVNIVHFDQLADAFDALREGRETPLTLPVSDLDHPGWQDASDGCWCWLLADPVPLAKPIGAKGKLNLWRFDLASD